MPNWCWNNLAVSGEKEDMEKFYDSLSKNKDGSIEFSFNDILPMPESLDIVSGSNVDWAVRVLEAEYQNNWDKIDHLIKNPAWVQGTPIKSWMSKDEKRNVMLAHLKSKLSEKDLEMGETHLTNIEKYGHGNWYDWRCSNWGTKWDCSEPYINYAEDDGFGVGFESAWAPPVGVIQAIGKKFPNLNVELEYSESGMGFGGTLGFQGGEYYDHEADMVWKSDCCGEDVHKEGWAEECEDLDIESFEHCPKCKEQCEAEEHLDYGDPDLNICLN